MSRNSWAWWREMWGPECPSDTDRDLCLHWDNVQREHLRPAHHLQVRLPSLPSRALRHIQLFKVVILCVYASVEVSRSEWKILFKSHEDHQAPDVCWRASVSSVPWYSIEVVMDWLLVTWSDVGCCSKPSLKTSCQWPEGAWVPDLVVQMSFVW